MQSAKQSGRGTLSLLGPPKFFLLNIYFACYLLHDVAPGDDVVRCYTMLHDVAGTPLLPSKIRLTEFFILCLQALPPGQELPQEHILSQNVLSSLGQVAVNFGEFIVICLL